MKDMANKRTDIHSDDRGSAETEEIHIRHVAKLHIEQYGAEASVQAARTADALLKRGDPDGFKIWMQIGSAIEEMQASDEQD